MARVMGIVTSAAGSCHQPFPRARQPPPRRVRGHANIPRRVPVAAPSAFSRTRGLREERGAGCRAGGWGGGRARSPRRSLVSDVRVPVSRPPVTPALTEGRTCRVAPMPGSARPPRPGVRNRRLQVLPLTSPCHPRWREDTWQRDIPPPQTNKQTHGVYDPRHTAWAEKAFRRCSWLWDDEARPGLRRLVRADGSRS